MPESKTSLIEGEDYIPVAPKPLPDGIYFGLDEATYRADPALGSTDIKNLRKHPADYWWESWRNPVREVKEKNWSAWGTAFHCIVCEGQEAYEKRYYRGPSKSDYQDLLVTTDDLKRWLRLRGYATSGKKEELVRRALSADRDVKVWDDIEEKAETLAGQRILIDAHTYDTVRISSKMITKNPECSGVFSGGYPEVSVFWTRDGVRCKARFDYMRLRAVVDLKSIRNPGYKPFSVAITTAIANLRYDIQAAHYCNGRAAASAMIRAGKVFGSVSPDWLNRLIQAEDESLTKTPEKPPFTYIWIFYQAEGAPIARRIDHLPKSQYHEAALRDVDAAIYGYRRYYEVFGDGLWVDVNKKEILHDEDLPGWMGVRN